MESSHVLKKRESSYTKMLQPFLLQVLGSGSFSFPAAVWKVLLYWWWLVCHAVLQAVPWPGIVLALHGIMSKSIGLIFKTNLNLHLCLHIHISIPTYVLMILSTIMSLNHLSCPPVSLASSLTFSPLHFSLHTIHTGFLLFLEYD